jgi:CheY-like chemotaxis protein
VSDVSTVGAGPTLEPVDILIVDDEPEIASTLREFLAGVGYRADVSGSIAAARRALGAQTFAMVLVDLTLPDGNGLDLMLEARESPMPSAFDRRSGGGRLRPQAYRLREAERPRRPLAGGAEAQLRQRASAD